MNYNIIFCEKEGRFCSLIEKETDDLGIACTCPVLHYYVAHNIPCEKCKAIKTLKQSKER
jgi:hypothetical protein